MSKFNEKKQAEMVHNNAGGQAYKQSSELELVTILLNSFVADDYYTKSTDQISSLSKVIANVDPEFAAKAAVYARNEFGMRSITHVFAAEIAKHISGKPWAKHFYREIVARPDDMTETLAYYFAKNGKSTSLPNSLKKGFKEAFNKFDGYQLAKYRNDKKEVSLVDVVNLVHPKATSKNEIALKKLVNGELRSEGTFESVISEAGKQGSKAKSEGWESLVLSGKIGQMALLKNMRNIVQNVSDETLDAACELLTKESRIRSSKILPFRYVTAMDEMLLVSGSKAKRAQVAISKALDISCANVPKYKGETAILLDLSDSMKSQIAGGKMSRIKAASLFAAMMAKANHADTVVFGTDAKHFPVNVNDSVIGISKALSESNRGTYHVGHGTNFHTAITALNRKYDRIFIFSDMEAWDGYYTPKSQFAEYKRKYNQNVKLYTFNLAANGTMQFPENNVFALRGFSEKIFDVIDSLEIDKKALLNAISNYIDFTELAAKNKGQ